MNIQNIRVNFTNRFTKKGREEAPYREAIAAIENNDPTRQLTQAAQQGVYNQETILTKMDGMEQAIKSLKKKPSLLYKIPTYAVVAGFLYYSATSDTPTDTFAEDIDKLNNNHPQIGETFTALSHGIRRVSIAITGQPSPDTAIETNRNGKGEEASSYQHERPNGTIPKPERKPPQKITETENHGHTTLINAMPSGTSENGTLVYNFPSICIGSSGECTDSEKRGYSDPVPGAASPSWQPQ